MGESTTFVAFRESTSVVSAIDAFCAEMKISRSDFMRLSVRRMILATSNPEKENSGKDRVENSQRT